VKSASRSTVDRALVPLLGYAAAAVMLFLMMLTCVDASGAIS